MNTPAIPIAIRPATRADLSTINDIYNYYVDTSTCTYQEAHESMIDRIVWFERHGPAHPIIVAESSEGVIGWGSLSPFQSRSAYRFTVEDSVYVRHDRQNHGVGSALLRRLVDLARQHHYRAVIGGIDAEQLPSIQLHRKFGFDQCALLKQVGFKFGRWLDVVYMQLLL